MAASASWMDLLGSALLAEAEAFRDGVRLIPQGTMEHILVETDSQELALLWKNRRRNLSEISVILDEVEEMASYFSYFRVIHTRRSANFAAHLCAQHATSLLDNFVWSLPPSFLQQCLQFDYNNAVY